MSTLLSKSGTEASTNPRAFPRFSVSPVAIWASIGAAFLATVAYVWFRWITGPYFHPVDLGDAVIPPGELILIRSFEIGSVLSAIVFLWYVLIKPWRRSGSISWDGLMVLAIIPTWAWDPMSNAVNHTWQYNGYGYNMSSWANYIPWWSAPNGQNFAEPIFLQPPSFTVFFLGSAMFGCYLLRQLRNKYPAMSPVLGFVILMFAMSMIDAITENFWVHSGGGAYPGVIHALSMYPNTAVQWPLYAGPIMGFVLSLYTVLRYYRDDKGYSFCEKGVDKLNVPTGAKTFIRYLALSGVAHCIFLFGYYVPWNAFAIHVDTSAPLPSYVRHATCGKGTAYACPSPYVPIQTSTSIPIGPDDPRLPAEVRAAQDGPPYSWFAK
jgi:Spirocyclase AveC-like